jgi:hypothetical protein
MRGSIVPGRRHHEAVTGAGARLALALLIFGAPFGNPAAAQGTLAPVAPGGRVIVPDRSFAPLQPEPGDVWAEVRSWTRGAVLPDEGAESPRRRVAPADARVRPGPTRVGTPRDQSADTGQAQPNRASGASAAASARQARDAGPPGGGTAAPGGTAAGSRRQGASQAAVTRPAPGARGGGSIASRGASTRSAVEPAAVRRPPAAETPAGPAEGAPRPRVSKPTKSAGPAVPSAPAAAKARAGGTARGQD